jgi:hypothetical protein
MNWIFHMLENLMWFVELPKWWWKWKGKYPTPVREPFFILLGAGIAFYFTWETTTPALLVGSLAWVLGWICASCYDRGTILPTLMWWLSWLFLGVFSSSTIMFILLFLLNIRG